MSSSNAASGWRFNALPDYAFPRLRALLDGQAPGARPIDLSLGEPRHAFPSFVLEALHADESGYGRYPPNEGTPAFRAACAGWLGRRYGLGDGLIDPDVQILPVNGTREALFSAPLATAGLKDGGARPAILIPNPYYNCYAGAALAADAEPVFVDTSEETGNLPDYTALSADLLDRTLAVYVCSPANPQGNVATRAYWTALIECAERHDFLILADECYAEIYDRDPPAGILEAAAARPEALGRILAFHSLSKRSNLPGLRSGFVTGGREPIARYAQIRRFGGSPSPLPVLAAATAAWSDDTHVVANRALYRQKVDLAQSMLECRLGFYRPPGGFFLWLDVHKDTGLTGEDATLRLWREAGVRVLPGAFLARDTGHGNPGAGYVRIALVHDETETTEALERITATL